MAKGFFLYHLDETTCGGRVRRHLHHRRRRTAAGDPVTCGIHEGVFRVCGGMGDTYSVNECPERVGGLY
ncbi:hypothetical protein EH228_18215 [Erwinia endophytica]|uniref:hypothetical protein n=1 Tax=Erwinia endophytica TaxID=1563158 RepID=UPI001265F4A1|nr:hypothetical protein [Erwinia endophytica]KAB8306223.1 hypothetical protein EH228_18215 [Erwinia endophytica]